MTNTTKAAVEAALWPLIRMFAEGRGLFEADGGRIIDTMRALVTERDAALAGAVMVKPLVWGDAGRAYCIAETVFGQAAVQNESTPLNPNRWGWWAAGVDDDADPTGYADGPDLAKAAAQADFAARIRAAIEPDMERAAKVERMQKAIEYVLDGYGLNAPDFRQTETQGDGEIVQDDWIVSCMRAALKGETP